MNEPRRLREVGSDEVRSLLLHGQPTRSMTPPERARTAARVLGTAVPLSLTLLVTSKSLALAMAVGLSAVAVRAVPSSFSQQLLAKLPWHEQAPQATARPPAAKVSRPLEAPKALVSAGPAEALPDATAPSELRTKTPALPLPPSRTAEREEDELAREALLLERARAALKSSPARALSIASEHARSFPKGKLSLERELVAIDALQRSGRAAEARARGEALLRQGAGGIYESRIRRLLEKRP